MEFMNNKKQIQFFSDFDGTITKEDTLNKFLQLYADSDWLEIEQCWKNGDIGSRICLERQMQLCKVLSENEMLDFINSIDIDETFPEFLRYLQSEDIDFFIVSDGFDYFINSVLARYGLKNLKVYSNKLKIIDGKYVTEFPNYNSSCSRKSGSCKCNVLNKERIVTKSVLYAGDGLSDFCVAQKADVLFAKGSLLEYGKNTQMNNLIAFDCFAEVEKYVKNIG